MLRKTVLVGLCLCSTLAFAQNIPVEEGWRGSLRPWVVKLLGEKAAVGLLGAAPAPLIAKMSLPPLPALQKKNTDVSVYKVDSELRHQGKEFLALPAEKKRAYELAFLKELFPATRRAQAREEDLVKWLNVLENGGSREGVYRGLVLDEVYASLESYEEAPSPRLVSWTQEFAKKYLAQSFSAEALGQGNLFFIKRIIAEKVLEMLDALETKPQDLRVWYAVFSAQLAEEQPALWKGSIRANPTAEVHLRWAQKAHLQHIKSEVIIKLHAVMNLLQDVAEVSAQSKKG